MNKRKVSFMLVVMFITSNIFSGHLMPYNMKKNMEVTMALDRAAVETGEDNKLIYAYLNSSLRDGDVVVDAPTTDDSSVDQDESSSEGDSVQDPSTTPVTPPSNGTEPPNVENSPEQPSQPDKTNQSQVQIIKSLGSSELLGSGESYTPYGTIELSLKLSGEILNKKVIETTPPENSEGEEVDKPSEGEGDSDKPNGDQGSEEDGDEVEGGETEDGVQDGSGSDNAGSNPGQGEAGDENEENGETSQPQPPSETTPSPEEPSEPSKPGEDGTTGDDDSVEDDNTDTEEDTTEKDDAEQEDTEQEVKISTYVIRNYDEGTLGDLIIKAYEEAKKNSNETVERKKLRDALSKILDDMNAQLSFDGNGGVKKVKMSSDFAPDKEKYIKNIIDLSSMSSEGEIRASDVALRIVIRNENENTIGDKLRTNTVYTLNALEEQEVNRDITVGDDVKLTLTGLSNCKTGKAPALFVSKNAGKSNLYETTSQNLQGTAKNDMYVTQFKDGVYLDMKSYGTSEQDIFITTNSIRFRNITFKDTDRSISRVEIQDDQGYRYNCSLTLENTDTFSIEVNGLKSSTPYVFTKLFITSDMNGRTTTQELNLGYYDNGTVKQNYEPVVTLKEPEPKIQLAGTNSSMIKLPNGLDTNIVKNSDSALRYVFKVDNKQGNVLDLNVTSLTDSETYRVEKMIDKTQKENYYIVTLNNLTKNKDYGFVILELNYLDSNGNVQIARKSLSTLNPSKGENIKYDNTTEGEPLPVEEAVQISLNDNFSSSYARVARVPILIDDLENRIDSIEVKNPDDNPDAKVSYDNFVLQFSDLKPETSGMFTVIFNCNNTTAREANQIKRYVRLTTTETPDYDIKSADINVVDPTKVNIKLNTYSEPKSKVKSVSVYDDLNNVFKSTWDNDTNTIKLEGLKPEYTYTNVIIRINLENGKSVEYPLGTFKTVVDENKPKGEVAEFVRRVYNIALGREPEGGGWNFWIEKLQSKELSATEFIAENLMTQPEFVDRELTKSKFVSTMYTLIVDREAEEEGQRYWEGKYVEYRNEVSTIAQLRIKIAREMMDQPEFKELVSRIGLIY
ncbi:DUF4214 domain-containing protein [Candidatus Arthromitus sp. SFB-rat-Yit]|uniref:DUF4214 domain-containing protein n=1 Tax=Candidatus Arthromitus sp. SFB-rat-Yit TaxID=1041504 RepID=UPI000227A293|nr:DUF4214 domain-containing protein [Candidatus Arthromitus sp. SFB-rat-Yit]BAK81435.1 hypothetical protein RATSFB_0873 [Candidatus Arthromitus sp. SFB-rat-Yit]